MWKVISFLYNIPWTLRMLKHIVIFFFFWFPMSNNLSFYNIEMLRANKGVINCNAHLKFFMSISSCVFRYLILKTRRIYITVYLIRHVHIYNLYCFIFVCANLHNIVTVKLLLKILNLELFLYILYQGYSQVPSK